MDYFDSMLDTPNIENVRDRGSKKWTAMMLPEHVKLIREYTEEQQKIPRPELDEFDLQVIGETIYIASKRKGNVLIKLWKEGEIKGYGGTVENLDILKKTIQLDNPFGLHTYKLDDIVDVSILD